MKLTINMRVKLSNSANIKEQAYFEQLLLDILNGTFPSVNDIIKLPERMFHDNSDLYMFLKNFYDEYVNFSFEKELNFDRAILSTEIYNVNQKNKILINKFPGESQVYLSADSVDNKKQAFLYPTEFLNTLEPSMTSYNN